MYTIIKALKIITLIIHKDTYRVLCGACMWQVFVCVYVCAPLYIS